MKFIDECERNYQFRDDFIKYQFLPLKPIAPHNYLKQMVDKRNHLITNYPVSAIKEFYPERATFIPIYASRKYACTLIFRTARGKYYIIIPCWDNTSYSWAVPVTLKREYDN